MRALSLASRVDLRPSMSVSASLDRHRHSLNTHLPRLVTRGNRPGTSVTILTVLSQEMDSWDSPFLRRGHGRRPPQQRRSTPKASTPNSASRATTLIKRFAACTLCRTFFIKYGLRRASSQHRYDCQLQRRRAHPQVHNCAFQPNVSLCCRPLRLPVVQLLVHLKSTTCLPEGFWTLLFLPRADRACLSVEFLLRTVHPVSGDLEEGIE